MKKILNELLAAIDRKDKKAVKRMLKEHPYLFHAECPQQWPVIHRCVEDPVNESCLDLDLAKLFVSHGGDVNQKAGGGVSLLFLAATNFESQPVAEYLRTCGARMSVFEQAVAAIMREDNKKVSKATVLKLVDQEPHLIREADFAGYTLLHHACRNYADSLVAALLDRGADPNAVDCSGATPLTLCGRSGKYQAREHVACRKMLLEKGARYSAREELADLIYEGRDDEAIKRFEANPTFRNAWFRGFSYLHATAWYGRTPKVIKYLLSQGMNPNVPDDRGRTALFLAPTRTSDLRDATLEIMDALIRNGADVNHRDDEGNTALHSAAGASWEDPAMKLVEAGADINAESDDGWTPLDVIADRRFLPELSRWMKKKGAVRGNRRRE